jgi:hypothetical protein
MRQYDYDPFSTSWGDPYPTYARMRDECPVYYNATWDLWALSRYDDVRIGLSDYRRFSVSQGADVDNAGDLAQTAGNFEGMDPPAHTHLRMSVQPFFRPQRVAELLQAEIRAEVERLADAVMQKPEADLAQNLAFALPPFVVCRTFGFPRRDQPRLKTWLENMSGRLQGVRRPPGRAFKAAAQLAAYLRAQLEERRRDPKDDLLTTIAHATIGGREVDTDTAVGMCGLIIVAQSETSQFMMSNALYLLGRDTEQRAWLAANQASIPLAVEEVIRYESPVQTLKRTTTDVVDVEGVEIPKGATVVCVIGSANRDERKFEHAATFDVQRVPRRILGFGDGIHHCVGAPVARLEGRLLLETVLERMPNYRLLGDPVRFPSHQRGLKHLWAQPTPLVNRRGHPGGHAVDARPGSH